MHTHDDSGTIHIESPVVQDFTLQNFSPSGANPSAARTFLGHPVDAAHPLVMTVNGQVSSALGSLVLHDQDTSSFNTAARQRRPFLPTAVSKRWPRPRSLPIGSIMRRARRP